MIIYTYTYVKTYMCEFITKKKSMENNYIYRVSLEMPFRQITLCAISTLVPGEPNQSIVPQEWVLTYIYIYMEVDLCDYVYIYISKSTHIYINIYRYISMMGMT